MKTLFIGILLIVVVLLLGQIRNNTWQIIHLKKDAIAIKDSDTISQQYADAVEKELIQAWMDVCLFKTDADMSDDYDAQYMECECVVVDNMNKLVGGL